MIEDHFHCYRCQCCCWIATKAKSHKVHKLRDNTGHWLLNKHAYVSKCALSRDYIGRLNMHRYPTYTTVAVAVFAIVIAIVNDM